MSVQNSLNAVSTRQVGQQGNLSPSNAVRTQTAAGPTMNSGGGQLAVVGNPNDRARDLGGAAQVVQATAAQSTPTSDAELWGAGIYNSPTLKNLVNDLPRPLGMGLEVAAMGTAIILGLWDIALHPSKWHMLK